MKKNILITGILTALIFAPALVGATDGFLVETVQMNLNYIWNLIAGALVFFIKSRKFI